MKVYQLALLTAAMMGASQALAAGGLPSDATLAAMGLADLHVMSDHDGLAVRGFGYHGGASARGFGWAVVSTPYASAGSVNSYDASGKNKAGGQNSSYAGVEIKSGGNKYGGKKNSCGSCGFKPQSSSITAFSGGSSFGFR
jgi:hypothetical protein